MIKAAFAGLVVSILIVGHALAGTPTANYAFSKPAVSGDANTWGTQLDSDLDLIDSDLYSVSQATNAAGATFTGDAGSGGAKGAVPAPAAGSAAAGLALLASGAFGQVDLSKQTQSVLGNGSLGAYFKVGSFIFEFGYAVVAPGATTTVTLPYAAPSGVLSTVATPADSSTTGNYRVNAVITSSKSTFNIVSTDTVSTSAYWLVIAQ